MHNHRVVLITGGNSATITSDIESVKTNIQNSIGDIVAVSAVFESVPWGFSSNYNFLNQVVVLNCSLDPEKIISQIWDIERLYGREFRGTNTLSGTNSSTISLNWQKRLYLQDKGYQSRRMDIDILFYDDIIYKSDTLQIPHPLIQERLFVLNPLVSIMADFMHPVFKCSLQELLERLLSE